jgi:hypothetical protein
VADRDAPGQAVEILALTFTDKAADEMAVRVDQLVPYGYTDTRSRPSTPSAIGSIREYALELGLPPTCGYCRGQRSSSSCASTCSTSSSMRIALGDPTRFLARAGDPLQPRQGRGRHAGGAISTHADATRAGGRRRRGAAGADAARRGLRGGAQGRARAWPTAVPRTPGGERLIDFGDQVSIALRLVRQSAAARDSIAGRYRYILVDEFQDTNRRRPSS